MNNQKTLILSLFFGLLLSTACDKGPTSKPAEKTRSTNDTFAEPKVNTKPTLTESKTPSNAKEITYGAGVEPAVTTTSIAEIVANPQSFEGKIVKVEGMVTDVCAKRGCWIEVAGEKPGEKARFKVKDGEMVFPMSSKGGHVVAQGKVITQKLSLEETRKREEHYAKESGRDFDPASIKEGKTVFRIQGTGAVLGQ